MKLSSVIEPSDRVVAVVGGGGKTTTLYALAARAERAIVTSTVRIPVFDRDVSRVIVTTDPVGRLESIDSDQFPIGFVMDREGTDRYLGYDPDTVDEIGAVHDGPVLVKADGARMRDFKAPAEHEPRVPSSADVVVPVASVHVVGKPLTAHWVHRPERIEELTDTDRGERITPETVAATIANVDGGMKGVPPDASVVPLLTKVDREEHERVARDIASIVHERATSLPYDVPRVGLARFDTFDAV